MVTNSSPTATHRWIVFLLITALFAWVLSDAIFGDRNFVYRDASQFYYPLLKVVQDQWDSGRWPLWNPHENSGMPLLGNPASAVLYPPRIIIFQWLPISYSSAFKWYTMAHVLLCAWSAWLLGRRFGLSEWASGLAGMSYAFGAVVLFQYCNVIFLVGAAWVPLALFTGDRALSAGDWRWACLHGAVLAMQVFGGDPEAAYISGGLAAVYLALMDIPFALSSLAALALLFIAKWTYKWFMAKSLLGHAATLSGAASDQALLLAAILMLVIVAGVWWSRRVRGSGEPASPKRLRVWRRACLVISAAVALGIASVQWIPSWEFGRISNRAAGGVHYEPYAFWIAPWRFAEFLWPNVMGQEFPIQSRWLDIFLIDDKIWEPSLYFGSLPAVLAISAWGLRRVPHWQRWLSVILLFSLWASTGPAGGVSWYVTAIRHMHLNDAADALQDESRSSNATAQGQPSRDMKTPAGGLYWLMLEMLPGFDTFRYPAKLLTFAAIAFSILAGAGWDRLFDQSGRLRVIAICAVASGATALLVIFARNNIVQWLESSKLAYGTPYYGPLIASKAWQHMFVGPMTTAVLLGFVMILKRLHRRVSSGIWMPAVTLALVAVDIAAANKWMIVTAAQAQIDAVPKLVEILRDAEAAVGAHEPEVPLRIHRISSWSPPRWLTRTSSDQPEEVYRWEKDTIQPKHGLLFGINYTINEGTLEPYDYWWFFAPFFSNTTSKPRSIVYYPLRGFDMWGAKYFVLPSGYNPSDQYRGFITFLSHSTLIAKSGVDKEDYQVRRNDRAYPRAWIVHQIHLRPPIHGLKREDRMNRMREILYEGFDSLWAERSLDGLVQDPRRVVWIEDSGEPRLLDYQDPGADREADRCRIVEYEADRVEVEAEAAGRGVLVFADLLYPGWEVTVDGKPENILRANRIMRGVPLMPGRHHIVFQFRPYSVRIGAMITLVTLLVLVVISLIAGGRNLVNTLKIGARGNDGLS